MCTRYFQTYFKTIVVLLLVTFLIPHSIARADQALPENNNIDPSILNNFAKKAALKTGLTENKIKQIVNSGVYTPRIIELMNKPGESIPWYIYREKVITQKRISAGVAFIKTYETDLLRAEKAFLVPKEIITAIIGVETSYGANKGKIRLVDSLVTLGFYYPRRADYFKNELIEFVLLSEKGKFDPLLTTGSYAGAIGWPQFMPSSARKLAIDFDNDNIIDIENNPVDAIGSVGNYFKMNGWNSDGKVAEITTVNEKNTLTLEGASGSAERFITYGNFNVIKRYNNSNLYAMSVFELSEKIKTAIKIENQKTIN